MRTSAAVVRLGRSMVLARPRGGREDALYPVRERHVGSHESASGGDVPTPEVLGCASRREPFRQSTPHGGGELLLELVGRPALERPVRRRNDGLGLGVRQAGIGGAFTCAMDANQRLEEVTIRERLRLRPERANLHRVLERRRDGGLILGADPVEDEVGIAGIQRGAGGRDDWTPGRVAVSGGRGCDGQGSEQGDHHGERADHDRFLREKSGVPWASQGGTRGTYRAET